MTNRLEKGTSMKERVLKIPSFLTSSGRAALAAKSGDGNQLLLLAREDAYEPTGARETERASE